MPEEGYKAGITEADVNTLIATHTAIAAAHHAAEVAIGRGYCDTTTLLSIPGMTFMMGASKAFTLNRINYFPIIIHTEKIISQVTIEVVTPAAAGNKCRIGIYAADTDWQPGALQVASAELAIDAAAVVNGALTPTTLKPGLYLIALTIQADANFRSARYGQSILGFVSTLGANFHIGAIYVAAAYAKLPDSGTRWDVATAASEALYCPVFLKESTP